MFCSNVTYYDQIGDMLLYVYGKTQVDLCIVLWKGIITICTPSEFKSVIILSYAQKGAL